LSCDIAAPVSTRTHHNTLNTFPFCHLVPDARLRTDRDVLCADRLSRLACFSSTTTNGDTQAPLHRSTSFQAYPRRTQLECVKPLAPVVLFLYDCVAQRGAAGQMFVPPSLCDDERRHCSLLAVCPLKRRVAYFWLCHVPHKMPRVCVNACAVLQPPKRALSFSFVDALYSHDDDDDSTPPVNQRRRCSRLPSTALCVDNNTFPR
jgi:hypothetical protein